MLVGKCACVHACVRVWCVCYQDNAKRVQKRLLSKRRQPLELAADVVEHGLETGAEPYMQTKQNTLSWWQLSLLD